MRTNFKFLLLAILAISCGSKVLAQKANLTPEKGWEKITELPKNLNEYFFAIYDHTQDLGMVMKPGSNNQGTNNKTMWYTANVDPNTNEDALWMFASGYGEYQVLFNVGTPNLFLQTEWHDSANNHTQPWLWHTNDNGGGDVHWGSTNIKYSLEGWTLQNARTGGDNYIGPWDNEFVDGAEIAGNKKGDEIGHFDIYAIPRSIYLKSKYETLFSGASFAAPKDVSDVITNKDIDWSIAGWTRTGDAGNQQGGNKTFESWNNNNVSITQDIARIPNGLYKVTVDMISGPDRPKNAYVYAKADNEVVGDKVSAVASAGNYGTMGNEVAGKTLIADNISVVNNVLTLGVKDPSTGTSDAEKGWIVFDSFKLYYYGPTIAGNAIAIPENGEIEADTWYYFDVELESEYDVTSSALADIVYTTEGATLIEKDASITDNLKATGNELKVGRYYIKSSSANTFSYEVTQSKLAGEEEYKALADAIAAAEGNTLGFDKGEYAPYNNIEGIKALAKAKAVDTKTDNLKEDVNAITAELNDVQWNANEKELNAVYNGDFALSKPNTVSGKDLDVPGWTCTDEAIRLLIGDSEAYPGLKSIESGKALFVHGGKITMYGEVEGYTMPLAAHTVYKLAFQHTGWGGDGKGGNDSFAVSILDSERKGLQTTQCGKSAAGPGVENCWNTFTIIFTTEEAGNYVLNMMPGGNSTFTDITLFKADSQELVFGDNMPSYAPGTYPTVKIDRTFSAENWATAVYPFSIPADAATVATLTEFTEEGILNFSTEEASVANKPCLIKADKEIVLTNVTVEAKEAKPVEMNGITFKGVYSKEELVAGDEDDFINYVLKDNTLYPVGINKATVNAYRAYFQLADDADAPVKSRLVISVDGEATGINAVEQAEKAEVSDGIYYNVAGQRVAQPTNGIYIVNGKKVLIKK